MKREDMEAGTWDVVWEFADDITFCPEECGYTECMRNQANIRMKNIPHSYFTERPEDCPKQEKQEGEKA